MKCNDIKKRIDLELGHSSVNIDSDLKSHVDSCERCGLYYKEALQLMEILNSQKFGTLPGELDDIAFERIIRADKSEASRSRSFGSILSWRWAWVPAAVAGVLIMFLISPDIGDINRGGSSAVQNERTYVGNGVYVESDNEASALAGALISDDSELDLLSDELIFGAEVDDLIESLTDDEFELLYKRLGNINGSS